MRSVLRFWPAVVLVLANRVGAGQTVQVPAMGSTPAHVRYIFWACTGKAVPERAAAGARPVTGGSVPDAPVVVGPPSEPIVNGRYYKACTGKEQFASYYGDTIGVRAFAAAGIRAGIEQLNTVPTGWGQDFPGYMQRYGSAFGEATINNTVRYTMAAALHEDVRYLYCHHCKFGEKVQNAFLSEFTARHGADGHRSFSVTPIVASVSGPLIAYSAWYPPRYDAQLALKHSALGFGTRIGFRVAREFLFDRDTKEEKAAAESAKDVNAARAAGVK